MNAGLQVKRWWIYQKERFPLVANGLLIGVFSVAMVGYPMVLAGMGGQGRAALVAFLSFFCAFLQLRIADEFKDYHEDCRYRPERPVPRGLVQLSELQILDRLSRGVQVILAFVISPYLLVVLALVWGYQGLMGVEFFCPQWLQKQRVVYLLSHNLILPILGGYGLAIAALTVDQPIPLAALWLLPLSSCHGLAIEIGRKILPPKLERRGVATYSRDWGRGKALVVWLLCLMGGGICTAIAAQPLGFAWGMMTVLCGLGAAACGLAYLFLNYPSRRGSQLIYGLSALWVVVSYGGLGGLPLMLMR